MGRVDYAYHRATYTGSLRYFDFFGANVTMLSPAVTVAVAPRWTFGLRYALTTSDTATASGIKGHTLDLRAAHEIAPRVWARGGYVRGVENFDTFSIDRIGDFRANTANAAVEILLPVTDLDHRQLRLPVASERRQDGTHQRGAGSSLLKMGG